MAGGYSVSVGIQVENFSKWLMDQPLVWTENGYCNNPPRPIFPLRKEGKNVIYGPSFVLLVIDNAAAADVDVDNDDDDDDDDDVVDDVDNDDDDDDDDDVVVDDDDNDDDDDMMIVMMMVMMMIMLMLMMIFLRSDGYPKTPRLHATVAHRLL